MDVIWKGLESLLGTNYKVYRSSTIAAFKSKLATNNGY